MSDEEVTAVVRDFLATNYLGGDTKGLDAETPLLTLGILDSLRMVGLIAFLEKEFAVIVDGDDVIADNFKTLGSIAKLVGRIREG